jgi:F0F1-type ATP synthase membrane subunit b/b'
MDGTLILLAGVVLFLASAVLFLARAYQSLGEEMNSLRTQNLHQTAHSRQKATKLVEDARDKSLEIIEESEQKAQEILLQTDFVAADAQEALTTSLKEANQKHLGDYATLLNNLKKDMTDLFATMSSKMEEQAATEFSSLHSEIAKNTEKTQKSLESKMEESYKIANAEIEKYKTQKMAQLDQEVFSIVQQVVRDTLSKSLSKADHEAFVLSALEEAKKQHVL